MHSQAEGYKCKFKQHYLYRSSPPSPPAGGHEVWVVRNFTGMRIKRRFSHTDYAFGTPDNNTTFHVYVYNFTPPVEIIVSFSQYLKLNLLGFFYIFLL